MKISELLSHFEEYDGDDEVKYLARRSEDVLLTTQDQEGNLLVISMINILESGEIIVLGEDQERDPIFNIFNEDPYLIDIRVWDLRKV